MCVKKTITTTTKTPHIHDILHPVYVSVYDTLLYYPAAVRASAHGRSPPPAGNRRGVVGRLRGCTADERWGQALIDFALDEDVRALAHRPRFVPSLPRARNFRFAALAPAAAPSSSSSIAAARRRRESPRRTDRSTRAHAQYRRQRRRSAGTARAVVIEQRPATIGQHRAHTTGRADRAGRQQERLTTGSSLPWLSGRTRVSGPGEFSSGGAPLVVEYIII